MCIFYHFSGSVLSIAVSLNGELCFSGSADSSIGVWQLPGDLNDPFDVYGKNPFFLSYIISIISGSDTYNYYCALEWL